MALTVGSMDSSSFSTLFSGINKSSGGLFGSSSTSNSMNILSDYYSIQNGSYYKLMKSYYNSSDDKTTTSTSTQNKTDKTNTSDTYKTKMEVAAEDLKKAATDLLDKGKDSVFNKVTTKAEDGTESTVYQTDAIYDSVSKFVDAYNSVLTNAAKSSDSGLKSTVSNMTNATQINEKALGKLGITVGENQKLTIDEDTFKNADMDLAKSMFQTTGGYGYQISTNASMADYYASKGDSAASLYTNTGSYFNTNSYNAYNDYV